MSKFPRLGVVCMLFLLLCCTGMATASEQDGGRPNLPRVLESALTNVLAATLADRPAPQEHDINIILRFVTTPDNNTLLYPAAREHGVGVFHRDMIEQPLQTIAAYILDPSIPGEVLYPSMVRRNTWVPESPILSEYRSFLESPWPPPAPLVTRGQEVEETTPELSSGCYYSYTVDRLFFLTAMGGRTALLTASVMPELSGTGRKGGIVGNDGDWRYIYTGREGTNLSMLTWAKTHIYGSATVSVFIETVPGSSRTDVYIFKWTKAGWSGMNVVRPSHIATGLRRYLSAFRQFMESPEKPARAEIAAWRAELASLPTETIEGMLTDFTADAARHSVNDNILSQADFQSVLQKGDYAASLGRENAIAEVLKLRLRKALGLSLPPPVPPAPDPSPSADITREHTVPGNPPRQDLTIPKEGHAPQVGQDNTGGDEQNDGPEDLQEVMTPESEQALAAPEAGHAEEAGPVLPPDEHPMDGSGTPENGGDAS